MRGATYSTEQRARIAIQYKEGRPLKLIAFEEGVSMQTVSKIAHSFGLRRYIHGAFKIKRTHGLRCN